MARLDPLEAESAFRAALGFIEGHAVHSLVGVVLDFYEQTRFSVGPLEEDSDGLLYQWGTHDWGEGAHFELDLTRQLAVMDDDVSVLLQLQLTMAYPPTEDLEALGSGEHWCFRLEALDAFEAFICASAPYQALQATVPPAVTIHFEAP